MDQLEAVERLLPGFQEFLSDLALCNVTSGLRKKVEIYQRNISDYIDQHRSAPDTPLPPVPIIPTNNGMIDIQKQREESWRLSKAGDGPNMYQNTEIGGGLPDELYEEPVKAPPPPPMENRPPIKVTRVIDEKEDFYEDPDDQESGRGSMPPGSCSDEGSGNMFVFSQGNRADHQIEEDFNSDSTEYEDVDDEILEVKEKVKKPKIDKLQEFLEDHKADEDVDLIDRLHYYNNMISTIKGGNFLGKWEKRYCIATDGQLFLYKSYKDKKSKSQRLPLMGYDVYLIGQQSGKDFVFRINHHSMKHPLLLGTDNKVTSEKWVAVLKRYATIDHTIMPSTGFQAETEETDDGSGGKIGNLFSRNKKDKDKSDGTPQLGLDSDNNLAGYVNIYGARFAEPKIKRKWISIVDGVFSCSATKDDVKTFSFSLKGAQIEIAEKKEVKMKGAFKLSKEGEVYLYIEALNMLDAGQLLKKLVASSMDEKPGKGSMGGGKADSAEDNGMVARLLAAFETSSNDQPDGSQRRGSAPTHSGPASPQPSDETYDDIMSPPLEQTYENNTVQSPPADSNARRRSLAERLLEKTRRSSAQESQPLYDDAFSAGGEAPEEIYDDIDAPPTPVKSPNQKKTLSFGNFKGKKSKDIEKEATSPPPDSPKPDRKEVEKEKKKDKKEKEKKEKEKKDKKKEKEEKKKREKEEEKRKKKEKEAAEEVKAPVEEDTPPPVPASPLRTKDTPVTEIKKEEPPQGLQRKSSALNKFKDSEMSHLILKDKLMQDRKELETKKKEASKKKADLRAKMMSTSDPQEKEKLKKQVDAAQSEWSEINKQLVKISVEIEGATGEKKDTNANKMSTRPESSSVKISSSDTETVSKGTVSDRMKMFQQGN